MLRHIFSFSICVKTLVLVPLSFGIAFAQTALPTHPSSAGRVQQLAYSNPSTYNNGNRIYRDPYTLTTPRFNSSATLDAANLQLKSSIGLVMDQETGQIIAGKNYRSVVPIASISKLMTAVVVLESGLDMQQVITISNADVDHLRHSSSRLAVGSSMTRETALLLSLMSSDNRAAHALGRHYPGGVVAFAVAMNRKAQELGMRRTFFEEPTGLSRNNISTAQDLAYLVAAANTFEAIRNATTIIEATVKLGRKTNIFRNTNALVRQPNWEIGLSKTGYIREAGRCLVMQTKVNGRPMIIVLLNAAQSSTRLGDAQRIRRWIERG